MKKTIVGLSLIAVLGCNAAPAAAPGTTAIPEDTPWSESVIAPVSTPAREECGEDSPTAYEDTYRKGPGAELHEARLSFATRKREEHDSLLEEYKKRTDAASGEAEEEMAVTWYRTRMEEYRSSLRYENQELQNAYFEGFKAFMVACGYEDHIAY